MPDTISHGPKEPHTARPRWLVPLGALVVATAVLAVLAVHHAGTGQTTGTQPTRVPPERIVGLALPRSEALGSTVDLRGPTPRSGPWTVTVRRRDGSLGRHGAVVTYPVSHPATGTRVRVGSVTGRVGPHEVSWLVGGEHARIRGDLPSSELVAIASRTSVVDGRPQVAPPAGFVMVASGPYHPRHVREAHYGRGELVAAGRLNGTIVTGIARGGGFEDRLYATGVTRRVRVDGKPAVVSRIGAGSGTLAWELGPGVVAFVGYAGVPLDDRAVGILRRLAVRAEPLGPRRWQRTRPGTASWPGGFG